MTDKKVVYLKWLGDAEAIKIPNVNRHLAGVEFNGPDHIGRVEGADTIKYFTDGPLKDSFEESTKAEFEENGGKEPEDVIMTDPVNEGDGAKPASGGGGTAGGTGTGSASTNGSSTSTGTL